MIAVSAAVAAFVATVMVSGAQPTAPARPDRARLGGAVVAMAVAGLTLGPIVLLVVAVAGAVGRDVFRRERERRDRRRRARVAPVALEVTAARARSGAPLVVALGELDDDQRRALGVARILADTAAGSALLDALPAGGNGSAPALVVAAIRILDRTGAPAAGVLERVADRLRARNAGEALSRSESGQQLASAAVMAALPILTALGLTVTSDRAARFYLQTAGGGALLLVSTGLSVASWYWMRAVLARDLKW